MVEPYWSLDQALAWIVWRDDDAVACGDFGRATVAMGVKGRASVLEVDKAKGALIAALKTGLVPMLDGDSVPLGRLSSVRLEVRLRDDGKAKPRGVTLPPKNVSQG